MHQTYAVSFMTLWHKTLQSRFTDFTQAQQILMVCNELNRVQNCRDDSAEYKNSLERALELLDFTIADRRWLSKLNELTRARSVLAQAYLEKPGQTDQLQRMLLQLDCEAWKMLNTGLNNEYGYTD